MKTIVKNLSDTKVELTITLGVDELKAAEQVALTKLAKDIKVAGFRKGKVPVAVAAKNLDPAVLAEQTLDDALSKAVAEAFTSENIRALERPSVEVKKFVPRQILEFTAETQILPVIKLGNYKKLKVPTLKLKVAPSDVNDVIERMRAGYTEKKAVDRAAKLGDETIIDFVGKKNGIVFDGGTGTDYDLVLGSNSFIPGFEAGIVGKKSGETFDLKLKFPKDYHVADLKGADVVFTTTLKTVNEVALPVVDDAFAKSTGSGKFDTVKGLKGDITRELKLQKEREAIDKVKDSLVGQLIEASKVPVPEILLKDQEQSIERDMTQNLIYQNMTLDMYLESKGLTHDEWINTEVRDAANTRVKAGLVLAELSKVEKITATNDELDAHVASYKKQYANNPEVLKQFSQPEVRRDIANRLLTEKTVERLVELNSKK